MNDAKPQAADDARRYAQRLLLDWEKTHAPLGELLHRHLKECDLSAADRRLLAELTWGCVRQLTTLDALIESAGGRSAGNIQREPRMALRLCAYQLVYLDRVPAYAAVDAAVEAAKRSSAAAAGFVNAVARKLIPLLGEKRNDPAQPDRSLPLPDGRWRILARPLVGPEAALADGLAVCTGAVGWLLDRWIAQHGLGRARDYARACVRRPPLVLRVNRRRTDATTLAAALREEGLGATADADGVAVRVIGGGGAPETWPGFSEGWFQPQDRTAMHPAEWLSVRPGRRVLDLCAGRGTKATQLAERMDDRGLIVAADTHTHRLDQLQQNARRLGLSCIQTISAAELEKRFGPQSFEAVLVDVPCSNTGVLARRPDVRHRLRPADLTELPKRQRQLLGAGLRLAKTDAPVVYATCSIDAAENRQVVEAVLGSGGAQLLRDEMFWPPAAAEKPWRDGGYAALLRRLG